MNNDNKKAIKECKAEFNEVFDQFLKDSEEEGYGFIIERNSLTGITKISGIGELQGEGEPPFFTCENESGFECAKEAMRIHIEAMESELMADADAGITKKMRESVELIPTLKH